MGGMGSGPLVSCVPDPHLGSNGPRGPQCPLKFCGPQWFLGPQVSHMPICLRAPFPRGGPRPLGGVSGMFYIAGILGILGESFQPYFGVGLGLSQYELIRNLSCDHELMAPGRAPCAPRSHGPQASVRVGPLTPWTVNSMVSWASMLRASV